MEIEGFKAFNLNMTNRYGKQFEEGKEYHIDGEPIFGLNGNGFHFCKNLEDTFRYFDPNDCVIASVTGMGDIVESFDEYNEYFNIFACNSIRINHILSREEIISSILAISLERRVCRFISTGFSLNDEEVKLFRERYKDSLIINQYLDYYSCGNKEVFKNFYNKRLIKR